MKKLLTISILLLSSLLFSNELSWVDEQVEAIKPPRSGMSNGALSKTKNPFVFLKKDEDTKPIGPSIQRVASPSTKKVQKSKQILTLSLIMNNSAMINNMWYKKGDIINGYTITDLSSQSVVLTKDQKQLLLSTMSNAKNLKFKNK